MCWVNCSRITWPATLPLDLVAFQGLDTFSSRELTEMGWQTEPANPVQSRPLDHPVQEQRMGFPISKGFQNTDVKQTNQSVTDLTVTIAQMTSSQPFPQRPVVPRGRSEVTRSHFCSLPTNSRTRRIPAVSLKPLLIPHTRG